MFFTEKAYFLPVVSIFKKNNYFYPKFGSARNLLQVLPNSFSMIKIAICDDHRLVREGIKALLFGENDIQLVGEAYNGKSLLEMLRDTKPDILLLDIRLPDSNGLQLIPKVLELSPHTRLLMLSAEMEEESIFESINLGAHGFLHKDASGEEMLLALKTVADGDPYFGQRISHIIYKSYSRLIKEPKVESRPIISEREIEIIELLGKGCSCKEVANQLCISPRTVENHKNNILQKLSLKNTIELLRYAIKHNIVRL